MSPDTNRCSEHLIIKRIKCLFFVFTSLKRIELVLEVVTKVGKSFPL